MPYKWVGSGSLTRVHDEDIEAGEIFEPTESELDSFNSLIEEVDSEDVNPGVTATQSDESDFICGYETDNGPCQRSVDSSDEYCWQHK